nr:MAG TPA: hypothetical protein [Caudoviricetes sp.]
MRTHFVGIVSLLSWLCKHNIAHLGLYVNTFSKNIF